MDRACFFCRLAGFHLAEKVFFFRPEFNVVRVVFGAIEHLFEVVGPVQQNVDYLHCDQQVAVSYGVEQVLQPVRKLVDIHQAKKTGITFEAVNRAEYFVDNLQVGGIFFQFYEIGFNLL